jgi:hypothetical protein
MLKEGEQLNNVLAPEEKTFEETMMDRRQEFIDRLEKVDSMSELKKAVEEYATIHNGEKSYADFSQDHYPNSGNMSGIEKFKFIMEGLEYAEANQGGLSAYDLGEHINDYAIEAAVARILELNK